MVGKVIASLFLGLLSVGKAEARPRTTDTVETAAKADYLTRVALCAPGYRAGYTVSDRIAAIDKARLLLASQDPVRARALALLLEAQRVDQFVNGSDSWDVGSTCLTFRTGSLSLSGAARFRMIGVWILAGYADQSTTSEGADLFCRLGGFQESSGFSVQAVYEGAQKIPEALIFKSRSPGRVDLLSTVIEPERIPLFLTVVECR